MESANRKSVHRHSHVMKIKSQGCWIVLYIIFSSAVKKCPTFGTELWDANQSANIARSGDVSWLNVVQYVTMNITIILGAARDWRFRTSYPCLESRWFKCQGKQDCFIVKSMSKDPLPQLLQGLSDPAFGILCR